MRGTPYILLAVLAVLVGGCARPSMVGKWEGTYSKEQGLGFEGGFVTDYRADGTFITTSSITVNGKPLSLVEKGTWEVRKDGARQTLAARSESLTVGDRVIKPPSDGPLTGEIRFKGNAVTWLVNADGRTESVTMTRVGAAGKATEGPPAQ
jgi:hypothetical protein